MFNKHLLEAYHPYVSRFYDVSKHPTIYDAYQCQLFDNEQKFAECRGF